MSSPLQDKFINKPLVKVSDYSFDYYDPLSVNSGIQLVYRQEWRFLRTQRGDLVRTLPLGPKQVEKISAKIIRRDKFGRTSEATKAVESTTEMTDTAKDSNEIVNEATTSETFGANASVSASFGGIGGSGGVNYEESASQKVGATNAFLTESMQKTANKVRTESKIVISTESETTVETNTASEITNPNDEVAITYKYSKYQRQYEVYTHLNSVNRVIFLGEKVPEPYELEYWIKENDWIIGRVLLDASFADILAQMGRDIPQSEIDTDFRKKIDALMDKMSSTILPKLAGTDSFSLDNADPSQETQRSLSDLYKLKDEKERSRRIYQIKKARFIRHIRDNILHYSRAVWSREDPEQRLLRYKKEGRTIPTRYTYVDGTVSTTDFEGEDLTITGTFEPDPSSDMPVNEVLNPAGPIGYHGNYAVFYAKPSKDYLFELRESVSEDVDGNLVVADIDNNHLVDALGLMMTPYADPDNPAQFTDPMWHYLRTTNDPADTVFTKELKLDMIKIVPDLRQKYYGLIDLSDSTPENEARIAFLDDDANFNNRNTFTDYLYRKEYSRTIVVDTNNLLLDLEIGSGSALEPFKRVHRYEDAMKVREERKRLELENERLQARLDAGILDDPDIENKTDVTVNGGLMSYFVPPGLVTPGGTGTGTP
jgi:hypothetical protein